MSNKYDSVLKEKKKYEEVIDDRHFLRRYLLLFNFLAVILILLISFSIYFFNILKPSRIIYDDLIDFFDYIDILYDKVLIDDKFNSSYNLSGNMSINLDTNYEDNDDILFLNDLNLEYSILEKDKSRSVSIKGDDYSYKYFENGKKGYLNYEDKFISYDLINSSYYLKDYKNALIKILDFLYKELDKSNLKKSVFIHDEKLVVSVDLSLSGSYINKVYSNMIKELEDDGRVLPSFLKKNKLVSDTAKYQINIKNGVFDNDLVSFKMIINDNDYRGVITYSGDTLEYNDGNTVSKCVLKKEGDDFVIRFYVGDKMKYVLSGKGNDNSYVYTYHVIEVVDNFKIRIKRENNKYDYSFEVNKETENKRFNFVMNASLNYSDYVSFDKGIVDNEFVLYSTLEQKLKDDTDNYVNRLYNSLINVFNIVK